MSGSMDYGNTKTAQHALKDQVNVCGFEQHCKLFHGSTVYTERGYGNSFAWHQFYHHKRSKYTTSVDIQTSSVKASHSLGEVGASERVGGENVRVRQRFVNVFIYLFILNVAS